jgi:hypothetical protein
MTAESVYRRKSADGAAAHVYAPTELAMGPWDDRLQHGGPVAALLVRAMDRLETPVQGRVARLVVEILRPVAMAEVRVEAHVVRPGRKVTLVEARMLQPGPRDEEVLVATASAWRLATSDTTPALYVPDPVLPPVEPDELVDPLKQAPAVLDRGFVGGLEWVLRAEIGRRGAPTTAWARPRFDLVAGDPITDLERLVMVADTANGVGMRVDPTQWMFMNTDLTIHLHTAPRGPWVGLVAESTIGADGVGTGAAILHDENGPVGRLAQVLLVEAR